MYIYIPTRVAAVMVWTEGFFNARVAGAGNILLVSLLILTMRRGRPSASWHLAQVHGVHEPSGDAG